MKILLFFWGLISINAKGSGEEFSFNDVAQFSLFPSRHLQGDVCGKHEAQLHFQLLEMMFD